MTAEPPKPITRLAEPDALARGRSVTRMGYVAFVLAAVAGLITLVATFAWAAVDTVWCVYIWTLVGIAALCELLASVAAIVGFVAFARAARAYGTRWPGLAAALIGLLVVVFWIQVWLGAIPLGFRIDPFGGPIDFGFFPGGYD